MAVVERNRIIVLLAVRERGEVLPGPSASRYVEPVDDPPRYASPAMSLWEHEHRQRLHEDDDWRR